MKLLNKNYIVRRIVIVFFTLFIVTLLSFLLMRLSPIDPATAYVKRNSAIVTEEQIEEARVMLGLDKSLPEQYIDWVYDALHMDFGISLGTGNAVTEELAKTVPVTLTVVAYSAVIMMLGVLIVGTLGYFWRDKVKGILLSFLVIVGISVPGFYIGTAFIDVFAVQLKVISVSGNTGFMKYFPVALCLSVLGSCFYGQMLSASLEREMDQDYAMYARCRGLSEMRILIFHALPHAIVDLLPNFAQMLGLCLANAAILERVFSLSGLGYLIIDAVVKRDSPMIHAAVLVLALTLALLDTVAELLQYVLRSDMRATRGK